jgi:hypothetical protein
MKLKKHLWTGESIWAGKRFAVTQCDKDLHSTLLHQCRIRLSTTRMEDVTCLNCLKKYAQTEGDDYVQKLYQREKGSRSVCTTRTVVYYPGL